MIKVDYQELERIVEKNELFRKSQASLDVYLRSWWADEPNRFQEEMRADLDTVLEKYRFENDSFAFSRSYLYDPPLDYIAVRIGIYDEEGSELTIYTHFYDSELEPFDDQLSRRFL